MREGDGGLLSPKMNLISTQKHPHPDSEDCCLPALLISATHRPSSFDWMLLNSGRIQIPAEQAAWLLAWALDLRSRE